MAEFILGRVLQGYQFSTIAGGVSALGRWALDVGAGALMDEPLVRRALKVAQKRAWRAVVQKLPLSLEDLRELLRAMGLWEGDEYRRVRDSALFLVGWAGMFRSSELVGLSWSSVCFCKGKGVLLHVPSSKTDPGAGAWVFVAAAPDLAVCPVRALARLRQLSSPGGAVFRKHAAASAALSKTTVEVRLRRALREAGFSSWDLYAAHSLRRGGATHAAQSGVPTRLIQAMGRWKSDAVRLYLYCSPDQLWDASRRLLGGA